MHLHQNTFTGGLDTDTSINKYSNSHYVRSENFRVIMGGENSSGAITTIDGNKEVLHFTSEGRLPTIIGLAELGDSLVVFTYTNRTFIFQIPKKDLGDSPLVIDLDSEYLKLNKDFGHSASSRLKIIASRETNIIKKVYFTDSNTPIYVVNLADKDIQEYNIDKFSVIPDIKLEQIQITALVSGALPAGRVQYAYQLYNLQGAESVFSPTSVLVNITDSSQSITARRYLGSDIGSITNKGVSMKLENLDTNFDRIRLVRILYEVLDAPPKIQVFKEAVIPDDGKLEVVDLGTLTLEEMVLEEFRELLIDPIPETIATKNNYLFMGNTEEEVFDFNYDAEVKRHNLDGETYTELKNPFNDLKNDGHSELDFRYNISGNSPKLGGGDGDSNVEYWFQTDKIPIDKEDIGEPYVKEISVSDGSYAKAEIAAGRVGYQRDEIYRFGLVGFDNKGRHSFVKWIDDIRMPDFKDDTEEIEVSVIDVPEKFPTFTLEASFFYFNSVPNYSHAILLTFNIDDPEQTALFNITLYTGGNLVDYTIELPVDLPNLQSKLELARTHFNSYFSGSGVQAVEVSTDSETSGTMLLASENGFSIQTGDSENGSLSYNIVDIDSPNLTNPIDLTLDINLSNVTESINIEHPSISGLIHSDLQTIVEGINNNPPFPTLSIKSFSISESTAPQSLITRKVISLVFEDKRTYNFFHGDFYNDDGLLVGYTVNTFDNHTHPISGETLVTPFVQQTEITEYTPSQEEFEYRTNDYNLLTIEDGTIYANVLYPVFRVKNLPPEVKYYQIVRVERDRFNRTVIDLGIANTIRSGVSLPASEFWKYPTIPGWELGQRYLEYISPEHVYNKMLDIGGDRLDPIYHMEEDNMTHYVGYRALQNNHYHQRTIKQYSRFETDDEYTPTRISESRNHEYIDDRDRNYVFGELTIRNRVWMSRLEQETSTPSEHNGQSTKGSCKLLRVHSASNFQANEPLESSSAPMDGEYKRHGIFSRRRRTLYPYGGISRSSLSNAVYIPSSNLMEGEDNSPIEVFNGDTYISFFQNIRGMWSRVGDYKRREARVVVLNFPVETTINLDISLTENFNYLGIKSLGNTGETRDLDTHLAMQEFAGNHLAYEFDEIDRFYEQEKDLYTFNSAYVQNNSAKAFFPKPLDFEEIVEWPNRVYHSDKKISGEFADSWLKLRPGNFTDLDTSHGELKLLKTFKDNLFFFQERGIGIIGVEQRELIQTDSPGPLVVGTGDILSPPYYLSTDAGIQDKYHTTNSRNVIYFYDELNKKFCRIVENGIEFISDTKNVSSLFDKKLGKVRVAFNPKYNEVLISTENEGVIVFNEYLDTFTSIYTTYHDLSEVFGQELYTVGLSSNRLFKDSYPGSEYWYDNSITSKLTLIVNPVGNIVSVYDVLEFAMEVVTDEGYNLNEFLTSVKVYNEYQETEPFDLSSPNVEQRFRTWRINTLVDNNEARIRSSSMFIELTYDNKGNKLILHDIITKFRTNIRYQQKSE